MQVIVLIKGALQLTDSGDCDHSHFTDEERSGSGGEGATQRDVGTVCEVLSQSSVSILPLAAHQNPLVT